MKKVAVFVMGLALIATVASAQSTTGGGAGKNGGKQNKQKSSQSAQSPAKSVAAEVASVDTAAKTITLKIDGAPTTIALKGKAVTEAASFKAGDKVTVGLHSNDKGEPVSITSIKASKKKKK